MNSNKVRAVQLAQIFSGAHDVVKLLNGAEAIEQFLNATGECVQAEQDAALNAASAVCIRSDHEGEAPWSQIVADAHRVFLYLTGSTSSGQQPASEVPESAPVAE